MKLNEMSDLILTTNILANFIINEYFLNARCVLIFTDIKNKNFNYIGEIPSVRIFIKNTTFDPNLVFQKYGCEEIVIKTEDGAAVFTDFEKAIRFQSERFNKRRYLIIIDEYADISDYEERFFLLPELQYVCDILLMISQKNEDKEFSFYLKTHQYVGKSNNNQPILLDIWYSNTQKFLFSRNLFPNKLLNQQGRVLRMATFDYEPYSVVGDDDRKHEGSELITAIEYAKKYNLTAVPVVNEKDYWGEIYDNWSGSGLLGNLVEDKADIGFSALYTWEFCYKYLDLTKPLVRTGITCLVPAPKLAAGWFTPLFAFSYQLWVGLAVTVITIIPVLLLAMYYKSRRRYYNRDVKLKRLFQLSITTVSKPLVLQSLTKKELPREDLIKFLVGCVFVFSLFLTSSYNSGFSSIMTVPRYEEAINTVEDFARSGIKWGATQDAWLISIQEAEEPDYKTIVKNFKAYTEEELRELSLGEEFAFSIERLPFENFAIGKYVQGDIIANYHLMKEDFYWEQCVIMARKNSILLPSLNDFILKVYQAGLIKVWQNSAVNTYMDSSVQKAVKYYQHHVDNRAFVKLKWVHVEGVFAALVLGICCSFLAFVIEVVINLDKEVL